MEAEGTGGMEYSTFLTCERNVTGEIVTIIFFFEYSLIPFGKSVLLLFSKKKTDGTEESVVYEHLLPPTEPLGFRTNELCISECA